MCLNPLIIPNKKANFHPLYDRLFNTVQCGTCAECLKQKRNDWYVRSYYEWKDIVTKGGFALFFTLTYNNFYLPHLIINDKVIPCFDKKDIQKFLDALRKSIKRCTGEDMPFRYIVTSEYGGNTYRPHYHGILFVYANVSPNWLRREFRRLWKYGFICWGNDRGLISSYHGIQYVVKYITKDTTYKPINKYLNENLPQETYKYYISRTSPFHLQSNKLGYCAKDYVSKELLDKGLIPAPTKNGFKNFHIPLYLTRKYYYQYNIELKGYYPKRENVSVLSLRSKDTKSYVKKHLSKLFENSESYFNNLSQEYIKHFTIITFDKDKLCNYLSSIYKTRFNDLIDYVVNERFYMYVRDGFPDYFQLNIPAATSDVIYHKAIEGEGINEFYYSDSRYSGQSYDKNIRKEAEEYMFNNLSENSDLERCLQILEVLERSNNHLTVYKAYKEQQVENQIRKLKDLLLNYD